MSQSTSASDSSVRLNENDVSLATGVKYQLSMCDTGITELDERSTIRMIVPIDFSPSTIGRDPATIQQFAEHILAEITSLVSDFRGDNWESSLVAIQMLEKKVYVLWDIFEEGFGKMIRERIALDAGRAVFAVTCTEKRGYLVQRAKKADKLVKKKYEMVKEMAGGSRPFIVDMYAGGSGGWLGAAAGGKKDAGETVGASVLGGGSEDVGEELAATFKGLSLEKDEYARHWDAQEESN